MVISNIILIDDSEATNIYHEIVLSELSTKPHIFSFTSCQEAIDNSFPIKLYRKNTLILLDINMPEMDAWEFLEKIEKDKHPFSNIKIALLSTTSNPISNKLTKANSNILKQLIKPLRLEQVEDIQQDFFT